MTAERMPEPEGPEDERFVYGVTAAGVEALARSAAMFDSEREAPVSDRDLDELVLKPAVGDPESADGTRKQKRRGRAEPVFEVEHSRHASVSQSRSRSR